MHKIAAAIIIIAFVFISITVTEAQPSVGVKTGYWVEYSVKTTGATPAAQDLTWAKIEILDVEGEVFHANFTVKYVNGTVSSSVRFFNFSAGDVQAWIIIPANLSPGESFYDSSINSNVTIQGQMQKTVAGADRTITFTNSTAGGVERNKEWDKATGFYVQSVDNLGNYTVNARATATNIWSPQILGLNQRTFYLVIATIIVLIVLIASIVISARKKD
ncbi:MAG: hypothetical protein ABSF44_02490 [Candidatus Bathyarchaeia archaeon]|jgi:hypothetical protein